MFDFTFIDFTRHYMKKNEGGIYVILMLNRY